MVKKQDEYNQEFSSIWKELAYTFDKKNTEYGAAYFLPENKDAWIYEFKRKWIRLEQIYKNGDNEKQAKRETLKDLAIYCIIELIRMEG